jgi:flagellar hook assembly protein FlgD
MRTCFWFDLARPSKVRITIYDIRQREVRHILPASSSVDATNRFGGRENIDAQTGCGDNRFTWDGRDDGGRFVPQGVYLAVFEADGTRSSVKIVFKGQ